MKLFEEGNNFKGCRGEQLVLFNYSFSATTGGRHRLQEIVRAASDRQSGALRSDHSFAVPHQNNQGFA